MSESANERRLDPLVVHPNRWRCKECCWRGEQKDIKRAPNPFDTEREVWGCPSCLDVECLEQVCDVEGCWEMYSCGWPSPTGYRQTCGKHMHNKGVTGDAGGGVP